MRCAARLITSNGSVSPVQPGNRCPDAALDGREFCWVHQRALDSGTRTRVELVGAPRHCDSVQDAFECADRRDYDALIPAELFKK